MLPLLWYDYILPTHIDGPAQDRSNSSALAMELLQSCTIKCINGSFLFQFLEILLNSANMWQPFLAEDRIQTLEGVVDIP